MKYLICLPCYNEEIVLESNLEILLSFCRQNLDASWRIVIADNASQDKTAIFGKKLAQENQEVDYFFVSQKGRWRALKKAWQAYEAEVYCYMDVDLSVGLNILSSFLSIIADGDADIAIGSRFLSGAKVNRSIVREISSRVYNILTRFLFKNNFLDAQCGFKALNRRVVREILPDIKDNQFFFDTELLLVAEKEGYKIKEFPVDWVESRNAKRKTKVKIFSLSIIYIKKLIKLKKRLSRQK